MNQNRTFLIMKISAVVLAAIILTLLTLRPNTKFDSSSSDKQLQNLDLSLLGAKENPLRLHFQLQNKPNTTSFGDFNGRVVHLNFWASWCAPCVAELESLEKLNAELAKTHFRNNSPEFVTILINLDTSESSIKEALILKQKHAPNLLSMDLVTQIQDESFQDPAHSRKQLASVLQVQALPYHMILNRDGKVVRQFYKSLHDSIPEFKLELLKLLAIPPAGSPQ